MRRYRVTDGKDFTLAKWDPADTSAFDGGKADARAELAKMTAQLDDLQAKFYADNRHNVLVVLQGTDTAGKGGAIRKVFEGVNPAGVQVASFKAPTEAELAHDFLWRVHPHVSATARSPLPSTVRRACRVPCSRASPTRSTASCSRSSGSCATCASRRSISSASCPQPRVQRPHQAPRRGPFPRHRARPGARPRTRIQITHSLRIGVRRRLLP